MNIPIVVVAFNRSESLKRLLYSLSNANYDDQNIELIISIDKGNNDEVYKVAKEFIWDYGDKIIIKHTQNLGLRKHVLKCGDIALENDAVIILEDDLYVSKSFYKYAKQSVSFYKNDDDIAGISLYTYRVTEFANLRPFIPMQDESDTYFVQVPSSWGQIWTKRQWRKFKQWYEKKEYIGKSFKGVVPDVVLNWKESSWKKYFHMYIASNNKYVVYPRVAMSTNMGEAGIHNISKSNSHQAVIMDDLNRDFIFKHLKKSKCKYDAFFENVDLSYVLDKENSVIVDYYGLKHKYIKSGYLLTTKRLNYKVLKKWELALVPYELNVLNNIEGDGLYLYDLSQKGDKVKGSNVFHIENLIKYEMPGITKEKAAVIFINGYLFAIKTKLKKLISKWFKKKEYTGNNY